MNLSRILTSLVLVFATTVSALAQRGTVVNFGPALSCPTYCTGFTTDSSGVNLQFINSNYNGVLILQVNGVYYLGAVTYAAAETISSNYPIVLIQQSNAVTDYAPYGTTLVVNIKVKRTTTKVNSGRAHYNLTKFFVLGGSITVP